MKSISALREMDTQELSNLYTEMRKNLYNLNVRVNDEGFKPHLYKAYKKNIARILTILKEAGAKNVTN
jgi:ribosomal protein L29